MQRTATNRELKTEFLKIVIRTAIVSWTSNYQLNKQLNSSNGKISLCFHEKLTRLFSIVERLFLDMIKCYREAGSDRAAELNRRFTQFTSLITILAASLNLLLLLKYNSTPLTNYARQKLCRKKLSCLNSTKRFCHSNEGSSCEFFCRDHKFFISIENQRASRSKNPSEL